MSFLPYYPPDTFLYSSFLSLHMKWLSFFFILFLLGTTVLAATLEGTIYNSRLEAEQDVLVEINTTPQQKYLAKQGTYMFTVPLGKYTLTARKADIRATEEVPIVAEGKYVVDMFLLPDFADENELWNETEEDLVTDETLEEGYSLWRYVLAGVIILFGLYRVLKARKKYGPLRIFRKKVQEESKKTIEQHKEELAKEPGYVNKALEIIKNHEGRISQKELRKEMLYLSEAKVSLIITELEHKGKVEKVKKGRGNVIILKND